MLVDTRRRKVIRWTWTLVLGFFLGGLFTRLAEAFLPESPARDFLTTSVAAEIGPFSIDLVAVALDLGPLVLTINVLTLVGITILWLGVRSWI